MTNGVLITGGSGYLGRTLARTLLAHGWLRVCIYSRNEFAQAKMRTELGEDERYRWFIGDVRDRGRLERAMQSVHALMHGAAVWAITGNAWLGAAETVAHWLIDFGKCENWYGIHEDQAAHIACKGAWAFLA